MSAFEDNRMEQNYDDDDDDDVPELIDIPSDSNKVIPVTILSGFLGSGKTTLLNYILTVQHGKRIAVIENEFSAGLGIEGMIAKSGVNGENISNFFELNNGCVSSIFSLVPLYILSIFLLSHSPSTLIDMLHSER
jgi:ABC-type lipoprotein export system ATPase subunit